jgi:hypothetical protein
LYIFEIPEKIIIYLNYHIVKYTFLLISVFFVLSNSAFAQKKSKINLKDIGIKAKISTPEGIEAKKLKWETVIGDALYFQRKESSDMREASKINPAFAIEIDENKNYTIAKRKASIESNSVNKLEEFLTDKPNLLFYKTKAFRAEQYHFAYQVKIGGLTYSLENAKGITFTKEQIEIMIKSAESIK